MGGVAVSSAKQSGHSSALQIIPWVLALASILVLNIGKRSLFGTALFIVMTATVTLAMVHSLKRVNIFAAITVTFFGEIGLFLAVFLLRFAPYMGYLGQVMAVLQPLLLVTMLLSIPLLLGWRKVSLGRFGFSDLVIIAQIVLLVSQLGVYGIARFLPGWQARGLEVQIMTVSDRGAYTCIPLVEGTIAYVAQEHSQGGGVLYQVDVVSGTVLQQITLPGFTPEQLGHPDWQDGGASLQLWRGVISRQDEHTLTLQYPTRFIANGDWVSIPVSIKLIIDLDQGTVSRWEKYEGEAAQAGFVPNPEPYQDQVDTVRQIGEYGVYWQGTKLHFQSPQSHYLLRCGRPAWLKVLDDGTLLMDQGGGRLYIVRLKEGR